MKLVVSNRPKILVISQICRKECTVKEHPFFNGVKGLIYIKNNIIEDKESFGERLPEEYMVTKVEVATWIKNRDEGTAAFILTFQRNMPEYIRIVGEYTLTRPQAYNEKTMQCAECQQYGYAIKRFSAAVFTCRKCAKEHPIWECTSDDVRCSNCDDEHRAGSKECNRRKYEEDLKSKQPTLKISRSEARKIINGETQGNERKSAHVKYVKIKMNASERRRVCPFKIEKSLKNGWGLIVMIL